MLIALLSTFPIHFRAHFGLVVINITFALVAIPLPLRRWLQAAVLATGAVDAIMAGMRSCPHSADVAEQGCAALANLAGYAAAKVSAVH